MAASLLLLAVRRRIEPLQAAAASGIASGANAATASSVPLVRASNAAVVVTVAAVLVRRR